MSSPQPPSEPVSGIRTFHRPARTAIPLPEAETINLAKPPPDPEDAQQPSLWQAILPTLGAFGIVGFALISGRILYLYFALGLAGLMLFSAVMIRVLQRRNVRRRERRQRQRYEQYLVDQRQDLVNKASLQRARTERLYPTLPDLWHIVTDPTRLWERRLSDDDFMSVRLGTGPVPARARPEMDVTSAVAGGLTPDLLADAERLVADFDTLPNMPVVTDLTGLGTIGVVGDSQQRADLLPGLAAQLGVFRSPYDLRFVVWSADPTPWLWMKWLPHVRDNLASDSSDSGALTITSDVADLDVLLQQIVIPRLRHLESIEGDRYFDEHPALRFQQVVLVLDGYDPETEVGALDTLDEVFEKAGAVGVTVLCLVDQPAQLPVHVDARLRCREAGTWTFTAEETELPQIRPDPIPVDTCEMIARGLAPFRLRGEARMTEAVEAEGILDLHGYHSRSMLDVARMWKGRSREDQLAVQLGESEEGIVSLDLKESAEGGLGPHGLLVGATGSGKSELLRTLVMGLAMREPPELLSFLLVDFKGGATFDGLEQLPHTAGTITNLEQDPVLIARVQEALFGELERRQRMLRTGDGFDKVSEYQAHWLETGGEVPPLPTLVVVIDEFGELIAAQPDFMDVFLSIGRTGRSLGVHLLLSSQRLEGGRISKLQTHLRYRLCLRTFSPEESREVIGSTAAYELPPIPGLGYLKVDNDLTQFRAALATRPYREPSEHGLEAAFIADFDPRGGTTVTIGGESAPVHDRQPATTEMEVVLDALSGQAGRRVKPVWLPPLPAAVSLDRMLTDDHRSDPSAPDWLKVPVGMVDRPRTQAMERLVLDFTGAGGHLAVIGATRSGKSTLLQTLIGSMALTHSPHHVQVYGIDYGGGGLSAVEGLPHVGAVFGRGHVDEVARLLGLVRSIITRRVELFRSGGISSMADLHRARDAGEIEDPFGEVFVVVDNWALMGQDLSFDARDALGDLVNGALHYGVHFVVTSNRWVDLKSSLRESFGGRLELRLNDPFDSEIDRKAAVNVPADVPGRGLYGGFHYQAALPRIDSTDDISGLDLGIEHLIDHCADRWKDAPAAEPVRVLPTLVELSRLPATDGPGIRVGLEQHSFQPWTVDLFSRDDPHLIVLGDTESGKTNLLRTWIHGLLRHHTSERLKIALIDNRRELAADVPERYLFGVGIGPEATTSLAEKIAAEMEGRRAETLEARVWDGSQMVLFIDDYDLIGGGYNNPLDPLVELLPFGRDLGFHVVVARRLTGSSRAMHQSIMQRLVDLSTPLLMLSGNPAEGMVAGVKPRRLPPGRGILVTRKGDTVVQTALFDLEGSR